MDYEYGLKTLKQLDTLPIGKWYPFESSRHNMEDLKEIVELRISLSNDFIISSDGKLFKRIECPLKMPKIESEFILPETDDITYKIEFRDQDTVEFDYSHLPDPVFRNISKKEREQYQARRTDQ